MANRILILLNKLPREVSYAKEQMLKDILKYKWRDTFSKEDYDCSKMKGIDIKLAMAILDVPFEFFIGADDIFENILGERLLLSHSSSFKS